VIVGPSPSLIGWMRRFNSDDVVAVLSTPAMLPFGLKGCEKGISVDVLGYNY
jgi:hypothetical protein